jgi:hypothetical protein
MSDDTSKIEDAAGETCPWSGQPIMAHARDLHRKQVAVARGRFAAAIDHPEKAIAARDVPPLAKGIA